MKLSLKASRIMDLDIENRPLTYLGHDFTTSEITAIAWSFGPRDMRCRLLGRDEPKGMLEDFLYYYNQATIVTGHYLKKHDLPTINGALAEYGLPSLTPKLVIDTYTDLKAVKGISKSQESLAGMLGIASPKIGMSQTAWRAANRLQQIELAEARVIGDVRQHQALRLRLTELGWLNPPKMWSAD